MSESATLKRKPVTRGKVIAGVVVVLLAGGLWWMSQNIAGITRGNQPEPTVNLLPPPPPAPPPPPPKPETPPPPDKTIEPPKPADQPKAADQPKQLTIAGPAQAGGDSFGIKAGSGGGSTVIGGPGEGGGAAAGGGGGFADASYGRYLSSELERAIRGNDRVNRQVFSADVAVWIDAAGRLTRARILRGSGDSKLDGQLVAALEAIRSVGEPPPASFRFPQKIAIRGRRA